MFTPKPWNDGPPLLDFMGSDAAPPIARRHLCQGGGGGDSTPQAPDYSQYIEKMTKMGEQGFDWAKDLFGWAKQQGVDLTSMAKRIGGVAETAATGQQARSDEMLDKWRADYDPLYRAQREDARRMIEDLPGTEESYAGKFGADVGMAIDQQLAAERKKQDSLGISPGIGSEALDTQARIGRAAATTAAGEQGRTAARTEARGVTASAINTGQFLPGVAGQQGGLATANRGQGASIPMQGAATSAGMFAPAMGFYNSAMPYMKQWGDTMSHAYDQQLAANKQKMEGEEGGNALNTILPLAGGIAGSFFGPMGTAAGTAIGGAGAKVAKAAEGGKIGGRRIPRFQAGGPTDAAINLVPPEASPSGGENVDDVHAMVSEGEFVIPERTVDWYGEKYFQNLIMKADKERGDETVAEPEEGGQQDAAAMDMTPPMFRSEGARV